MTDEQIIEMLKELIMEIDYDIYKEYFEYSYDEDEGEFGPDKDVLIDIVRKYIVTNDK